MKIIADENIHAVQEWFSPFGEVVLLPGRAISSDDLQDAEVLLVRSVTEVNESLLANTAVKFVGSATIGVDHIDQDYLAAKGITFAYAPGCNAKAVVQYVCSVMATLMSDWQQKTVGIIGCGNVGGRLYRVLDSLGVQCLCYDPFLTTDQQHNLTTLEQVLQADIVSLHTPLTQTGSHPTFHMLGETQLNLLKQGSLLINSGRGAVIDNAALLNRLERQNILCALDVWENEPNISLSLLEQVNLGTAHIAGYSRDGKLKGTSMIYDAFSVWLGTTEKAQLSKPIERVNDLSVNTVNEAILQAYDVRADDRLLRSILAGPEGCQSNINPLFDRLRNDYQHRLEFSHYKVNGFFSKDIRHQLTLLGFSL